MALESLRIAEELRLRSLLEYTHNIDEIVEQTPARYILFQIKLENTYKQGSRRNDKSLYHLSKHLSIIHSRCRSLCNLLSYTAPFTTAFQIISVDDLKEPLPLCVDTVRGRIVLVQDCRSRICKRCLELLEHKRGLNISCT